MKLKSFLIPLLLGLMLAACNFSLSEEITPPPGAEVVAATTAPSTATSTVISETSSTPSESNPAASTTTPEADTSTSSPAGTVTISGRVSTGTGEALPAGLTATLYGIENQQESLQLDIPVSDIGTYTFQTNELTNGMSFIVLIKYGGVSFLSTGGTFDGTTTTYDQPITIYESTTDFSGLSFEQLHITATLGSAGEMSINEIYVLTNSGNKVVTIETDGKSLPFASLPDGALASSVSLANGSADLLMADSGFAMLPGSQQYAFVLSFSMPYTDSLNMSQPFPLPPKSLTVILPAGLKISGTDLVDQGVQDFEGGTYQVYSGGPLAEGTPLDINISGSAGTSTPASASTGTSTLLIIGLAALGVLFVGLGVFLFLRDRKRSLQEDEEMEENAPMDGMSDSADRLADEILKLDDDFKAGKITKQQHDGKRAKLKKQLKDLL